MAGNNVGGFPPADGFEDILKDDIYVDKTQLIAYTNQVLGTSRKLICFSRPRRFGKSFAAQMLVALNQCDVLFWDMTWFITNAQNIEDTVKDLQRKVIFELKRELYIQLLRGLFKGIQVSRFLSGAYMTGIY